MWNSTAEHQFAPLAGNLHALWPLQDFSWAQ